MQFFVPFTDISKTLFSLEEHHSNDSLNFYCKVNQSLLHVNEEKIKCSIELEMTSHHQQKDFPDDWLVEIVFPALEVNKTYLYHAKLLGLKQIVYKIDGEAYVPRHKSNIHIKYV